MKLKYTVAALALSGVVSITQAAPDFARDIKPILEQSCLKCHGPEKPKGKLNLESRAASIKGGENGTSLTPGKPLESPLYTTTTLPADHDNVMPPQPKEKGLTKAQQDLLKAWIEAGAEWPESLKLSAVKRIDFVKDIQPIFEFHCVSCHREKSHKGGLDMSTREANLKGGDSGPGLVPGQPLKSPIYTSTVVATNDDKLMPPINKGGPLAPDEIKFISLWIEQGAEWPAGLTLTPKKKEEAPGANESAVVADIYKYLIAKVDATIESDMKAYTNTIPGTQVSYGMVPIKGGELLMGSPASEAGRKADEGPQHKVKVEPFWMGVCEITWPEYELFMYQDEERKFKKEIPTDAAVDKVSDAVARPTKPYVEMSFGMGKDGYPAISMTHHAANKYCEWLSAKTGHYYRLPTEAEWEYACRAGSSTRYSFGDDESQLGQYAWFEKNSDFKYQKVGRKKPNAWGLYDMHGNVAEWVLDGYDTNAYAAFPSGSLPYVRGTKPYPHVARGGSWDDTPDKLRSAARRFSDKSWKQQDPQLPKSIWYLTDAQFLGFRIVRPLKIPAPEELQKLWNNGVERE